MADARLYRAQHKRRLSWMPWLYFSLKPAHRAWAEPWQARIQARLQALETVHIEPGCFIAPEARIFAEPGRDIVIHSGVAIGANVFLHGPITLGPNVSVNPGVSIDGGKAGVMVGAGTRIATGATVYAFDHGMDPDRPIREQPVRSKGITIGADVWIGAQAGITDGVTIGDGAVIGMSTVVTKDVPPGVRAVGVPARVIGPRI